MLVVAPTARVSRLADIEDSVRGSRIIIEDDVVIESFVNREGTDYGAHERSFEQKVVPVLVKEGIGVLGMKPLGSGAILQTKSVTAIECLHYALNLPTSVVITGIDSLKFLDQALEAVRTFKRMSKTQVSALLSRTAQAAATGKYELFKTTPAFDATAQHLEWLG